jgi:hypothetical protein
MFLGVMLSIQHIPPEWLRLVNTSVLFDISQKGYSWAAVLVGLAFIGFGFLGWKYPAWRKGFGIHPIVVMCIGVAFALGVFLFQYSNRYAYEAILHQGQAWVVEGRIENFHPMPKSGHAQETFTVNGIPFAYSDYEMTSAFNSTASHGGPLRAGLFVRIYYTASREFDGQYAILRIETRP